jgi:hypothetical protein
MIFLLSRAWSHKVVSVDDFALRPTRGMGHEDVLSSGQSSFRF